MGKVIPIRPTDELIELGGLVDESSASLCLYGEDLHPEDVTTELQVTPTRAFQRGHRPSPGARA